MAFPARSFQANVLLFMAALLVLLQVATLVAFRYAERRSLSATLSEELQVGSRVLDRLLSSRAQTLSDTARVLASDFAFREAIASEDAPTIESVLSNHGSRIRAARACLVSVDGVVLVDAAQPDAVGEAFQYPELIARGVRDEHAFGTVALDGEPYQVIVVPVNAPSTIAFVAFGFPLDDAVLDEVSRLTGVEVSVRTVSSDRILTTLDVAHAGIDEVFRSARDDGTLTIGGERYASLTERLTTEGDGVIEVSFLRSIDKARQPFRSLELQLLVLASLALLAALGGSMLLARTVSRPLRNLVEAAERIEQGDYESRVPVGQSDEIGQLAGAFNDMRIGIGKREAHIRYQASHDSLTALPNRTLFFDRLESAVARAKRPKTQVGMLMLDLDGFKDINDTLGHQFGDELLREVARRLDDAVRESDTIARLGGDEFAVLLEATDEPGSVDIARRIRNAVERPFTLDGVSVVVTTSIGVGLYPQHADDAATLMKRADVAMYDAKRNHLQIAVYESKRDEHSVRRLAVLSELSRAIERDELELHYQPSIDIASGATVHAEALVRWTHPTQGAIPTDEFIRQAERSGKIRSLTRWVLRRAIQDCSGWNRSGLDLTVAVNLSALDLSDPELLDYVKSQLEAGELAPSRLVLEVTESAVMKDQPRSSSALDALRTLGIVIAIDDFGTGYSSLAQLRRLPVGELKIDKSFVVHLGPETTDDAVIVHSTIELGHNLGLSVVAEGVENAESLKALQELGCDRAQGYFISRPITSSAFVEWMRTSAWGQRQRSRTLVR